MDSFVRDRSRTWVAPRDLRSGALWRDAVAIIGLWPASRASWIAGRDVWVSSSPRRQGNGIRRTKLSQRGGAGDDQGGRASIGSLTLSLPDGLQTKGQVLGSGRMVVKRHHIGDEREGESRGLLERDVVRDLEGRPGQSAPSKTNR